MSMRKILPILVLLLVVLGGLQLWPHLRGIWPAISPDSGRLVEQFSELESVKDEAAEENAVEELEEKLGINKTNFPLTLLDGFSIEILASDLNKVRVLKRDPYGRLLASITDRGKIISINDDGSSEIVLSNLTLPHGFDFYCDGEDEKNCRMFVAETDAVSVYEYKKDDLVVSAENRRKIVDLPARGRHYTRTIEIMGGSGAAEDAKLLISVGSSCNVCDEEDWRRSSILVSNLDGEDLKTYASGLRNAVFMRENPKTGKLWVTEMARDLLGDDIPPDEVNIIEEGGNYGWPICYGDNVHDIDFDKKTYVRAPCSEPFEKASHIDIPAHSSPLGLDFFGSSWSEEFRGDLLVVYHGSWNRTVPTGYKVVRFALDEDGEVEFVEDFISGWLTEDGDSLGRPADVLIEDGQIFVSDDKAGLIYRIYQ